MTQQNNQQRLVQGRVAIYARVATSAKMKASQLHSNDLLTLAKEQGREGQVLVFEGRNVSGNAETASREAYNDLLTAITTPEEEQEPIRAIYVWSEDRLFRDAYIRDLAAFTTTCAAREVLVITPSMRYDFSKPRQAALFYFICGQANQAQMITSRLQAGKRAKKAAEKGE